MGSAAEQPEATRGSQILSSRRDESAVWTEGFRDRFHGIVSPLLFNGLVLLASALHATIHQASASDKQMWHKPTPVPTVVVTITTDSSSNFACSPQTLSITPGTIVIWRNSTSTPHTVTGNAFGSGTISPGGSFSFKFTQAGTFAYHCMFHPYRVASIVVK